MKSSHLPKLRIILLHFTVIFVLTGCNMPREEATPSGMDVTQAYQTVDAQLTQAVAQTPTVTTIPPLGEETPSPTTGIASPAGPAEPTSSPTPETHCDQAAAAYPKIDITVEDDTEMAPGEAFTKIWRVVNVGTCTWTPNYAVVWFSGEQFQASSSLPLNVTVLPGQSVDISVDMVAPTKPGTYQSNWKLQNAAGDFFGIGPNGESPFWVRIKVVVIATETPTPTPTATATPVVQASGSVTLVISDTLDLDNLLVNAGGLDLDYQVSASDPSQHQLVPLGSVTLGVFGGVEPTLPDCQSASMGVIPITVETLASGTHLCYRTDLGLPGWARIEAIDPDNAAITLKILTWSLP